MFDREEEGGIMNMSDRQNFLKNNMNTMFVTV